MLSLGCWQLSYGQSALDFEESSGQYVDAGTSINSVFTGTSAITVEGWVNLESSGTYRTIAGNYNSGMQFLLRIDNGFARFWVDNGSGFQNVTGTTTIPVGTWTHIAGSWDGTNLKVYVNGALENTAAVSGAFPATSNNFRIGGSLTGSEYMDGMIDRVRIWNVTRSDLQIAMTKDVCFDFNPGGLLAQYDFESGSGSTLVDRTGNGYDGTLVSNPMWVGGLPCDPQVVYNGGTGVNGGQIAQIDFNHISSCQSQVYLEGAANIWNGSIWFAGSYTLFVNGSNIGTFASPHNIDLTSYIPITSVVMQSSASTWHTVGGTLHVISSGTPPAAPAASSQYYCVGEPASPLSGTLSGTGTSLRFYTTTYGAGYTTTAPTPNTASAGTATYLVSQVDGSGCESDRQEVIVSVANTPVDQTVAAGTSNIICNGATNINLASSETGVEYFLRDDATNMIVDGPVAGNGGSIDLETGTISATTTYNVIAHNAGGSSDAIQIDGVDGYIDCGNAPEFDITGDITVEAWIYIDAYVPDWVRIVGKGNGSDRTYGLWYNQSGDVLWQMYGSANMNITAAGSVVPGQWYHIAGTRVGNDCHLYINGELSGSTTYAVAPNSSAAPLTIGAADVDHSHHNGAIDNVRLWNTGRSSYQIKEYMDKCVDNNDAGLVANYSLESGVNSTQVIDFAGGNHGTLTLLDPATSWVAGANTCGACSMDMSTTATVTIDPLNDETVTAASSTVCPNTATTIDLGSSQNGAFYFLRDDSNDAIIEGPTAGNGSALNMNTGNLSATTSYNVLATNTLGLDFNGANEQVDVTGVDFANQSFSIEFWAKRSAIGGNDFVIGQYNGVNTTNQALHIGFRGGSNNFTFAFWANDLDAGPVTDMNWHHYAVTYDAVTNARTIYMDGTQVAADVSGADYAGTGQISIGNVPWGGAEFNGNVDNLRIWNSPLTASEVAANMNNCISGTETDLIAAYNFNDGAGTTASDITGNFDGTLTNMDPATDWVYGSPGCACESEMTTIETVTVQDNAPTVAAAPTNMSMGVDAGQCGAIVNYTDPTFDDDCDGTGLNGTMTAGQASGTLFPIGTTTVTYEYTDGNGQSVSASFDVTITDDEFPTITAPSAVNVLANAAGCSATGVSLGSPTAADNCSGETVTNDAPATFPLGSTTVTWTVTDAAGNQTTDVQIVTVTTDLAGTVVETAVDCNGASTGAADLTVTGGTSAYSFLWDDAGASTSEDLTGLMAGTYNVDITDANGCTASAAVTVTEPTAIAITVDGTTNPTGCGVADGTASVTVSGGTISGAYTYSWSDGGTYTSSVEDPIDMPAGSIQLTVTDDNGCVETTTVSLSDPNGPTITVDGASSTLALLCNGDANGDIQIDVVLNGGATSATYLWDDAGATTTEDLSGVGAGTYSVTVTDNNSCVASTSVTVTEPTAIVSAIDSTMDVTCNGLSDGELAVSATGGTSPYTFDLGAGAQSTGVFAGVAAGTYTVTITDGNGCVETTSVTINEPTALSGSGTSTDELMGMDGTIDLTATGGTAPYTFSWTGPNGFTSTDEDPTGLEAGTYDVTITDDNGCTTTAQVIVGTQVSVYEQDGLAINLYPNPSNGDFTLVSNVNHGQLIVRDALGREVHVQNVIGNQTDVSLNVNESGIYFVEFRSDDKTQTIRVVVRK